jgi:hypothetical protein
MEQNRMIIFSPGGYFFIHVCIISYFSFFRQDTNSVSLGVVIQAYYTNYLWVEIEKIWVQSQPGPKLARHSYQPTQKLVVMLAPDILVVWEV